MIAQKNSLCAACASCLLLKRSCQVVWFLQIYPVLLYGKLVFWEVVKTSAVQRISIEPSSWHGSGSKLSPQVLSALSVSSSLALLSKKLDFTDATCSFCNTSSKSRPSLSEATVGFFQSQACSSVRAFGIVIC